MPRTKSDATGDTEKVGKSEDEEIMEEEVEYEEVEVEVDDSDEEEEEEEEEVEEVEVEVDEDDDDEEEDHASNDVGKKGVEDFATAEKKKKHAELLAFPQHGSEVYLGGFSHDVTEDELRSFCETVGEVTQVRIMKGRGASENKGYAFITFRTKEAASEAINSLNNGELKGRKLRCSTSQEKHRLFIGNVPRNWRDKDLKKVVTNLGPGVVTVELLKDPQNSNRNRGFAFIEYYNNACAEYSRQKMSDSSFKLDGIAPTVSWADPKNVDSASSSQVKAVYVKNLPRNISQDQLRDTFEHHGKILKVVLPPAKPGHENSRFGFVHFAEKSSTMKALKDTEKYVIDGHVLECSLAKPQADQKSSGQSSTQKAAILPTYPPPLGYGMVGASYGAFGAGFAQPMMYGRGGAPPGLAMLPMLLPDGRIGYVLQQPTAEPPHVHQQPHRGGRNGGGSGRGGRGNDRGRGGRRYNPY